MTGFYLRRTAVCAAALLTGSAALADVTAQDVWDNWKGQLGIYGENGVTIGSENYAGGVLTVTDLHMSMEQDGTKVEATLPQIVMTENGDGTVTVTMSESYPFVIDDTSGYQPAHIAFSLNSTGLAMNVSGTPEEMVYEMSADRYGIVLDEITEGGEPIDAEGSIMFNNIAGTYTARTGEVRDISYALNAASLDIMIDSNTPEEGIAVLFSGKLENIAMAADMIMPLEMSAEKPEEMFANGFAVDGGYTFGTVSGMFNVTENGMTTNGSMGATDGALDVAISQQGVSYDVATHGVQFSVEGGEIPFPVQVSLAEYGIGITMPLSRTEEPAPFRGRINLTDLSVNDQIWQLVDPGAVLPHDPATLAVDISGTVKMLFDLMDPEQQMAMAQSDMPFEPHSISLDTLNLAIAGAQLTGSGAFTFDPADTTTIPGVPRPEGSITVQANGLNGLIDKLVQMGLVPEDQVMGARMMMGMFATVTGDDQLESSVEINAQGHILVNGQRIQ